MKYKILIADYDDTFAGDDGIVPEENLKAIHELRQAGGIFAINTGRMTKSILPIAKKLKIEGYIGCYQGGVIVDNTTGEIIKDSRLSLQDTVEQLKYLSERGIGHTHLYDMDRLYVQTRDESLKMYEEMSNVTGETTGIPLYEYAEKYKIRANKLLAICEPDVAKKLQIDMSGTFQHLVYVLSKPYFIEILLPNETKSSFVKFMGDRFQVPVSDIITVGDSMNDMDMIKVAGQGMCVENGMEELKKCSDVVLPVTNNQAAIAYIIRNYMLNS